MSDFDKASRLSTRDLLIEEKLNKIANDAVPKRAKSPKMKFKRNSNLPVVQSTGFIPEMALRDIILDAQVNRISNGAIEDTKGQTPNTIKSPVTQQMIDEMQLEQQSAQTEPIKINGREYKYNPLTMPPPTLDDPMNDPEYKPIRTDAEIQQMKDTKVQFVDEIRREQDRYDQRTEELSQSRNLFDIESSKLRGENIKLQKKTLNELHAEFPSTSRIRNKQQAIQQILQQHPGDPKNYQAYVDRVNLELADIDAKIRTYESEIDAIDRELLIQEQSIKDNLALQVRADRDNKAKLNLYANELNAANRGRLNVGQNSNELDVDYLQRLIDIGQTLADPDQILDSAILINTLRAKKNLEQVITDKGKVETIVKMISPEDRFMMNKQFERVKKVILETFGKDNKSVSESDMVGIIQYVLSTTPNVGQPQPITLGQTQTTIQPIRAVRGLNALPSNVSKSELISALTEYNNAHAGNEIQFIDTEGNQSLYAKLVSVGISTREEIKRLARLASTGAAQALPVAPTGLGQSPYTPSAMPRVAPIEGSGFHNYPKLVPFGKIMISPDKLYYRNVLQVRTNKGKQLTGISNMRVSETLVSIIMKALEGNRVNKSELNLLSTKERHVYDNLMYMSGGHKHHETTLDKTTHEMKERLDLIEGELDAGNNNPMLIKELHALLHRMARTGLITMNNAAKHYKELKDYYSLKPQK